jgi:hypothetical protein
MNDEEQATAEPESSGTLLVTVLYSAHRDVYKVPSCRADLWLSVQVYPSIDYDVAKGASVGQIADGRAWRRAYRGWAVIQPGQAVTLPADDPLVVDYLRQAKAEEL